MEQTEKSRYLGEEKIGKLLIKFSIPCILSLLVSALYNIVDQIFIGNSELGYLGNAATGIVFPITIISLAFAWCFGDGCAAFLSICQGRRDTQSAHKCVGSGITVTLLTSVVLVVLCAAFKEPVLRLFGASDATIGLASDYFTIILWGLPIYMLMNMMNSVIRADGSPSLSMASMVVGAVINIILDPIFIFALHWGIKGAAYATVIGQVVSFFISFFYFFKTKTFRLKRSSFLPDFRIFRHAVQLGSSTFITQMSIVVISLVCNVMLFQYGTLSVYGPDIPISVISIETKVFTIVINIVVGIILGAQPILGYNFGARNYTRVKETFRLALTAVIGVGIVSTLIFELAPGAVVGIFGSGSELYDEFAQMTFRIFLSLITFTSIIKMTSIFFQAVGQPVKAAVLSLTRDIVCFVPLVILLPRFYGIKGILFAAPAADVIAMIVTLILIVRFFKTIGQENMEHREKVQSAIQPSRPGVIITIGREHGSAGKQIGLLVARELGIPCYYKELTALAAQEIGFDQKFISDINANAPKLMHELYLSTDVVQQAILAQEQIIKRIAENGSCVIVGRAADYVLRNYPNVVRIFIHAPKSYRIQKVREVYGDTEQEAIKSIAKSDAARGSYYHNISGADWGLAQNYDLCIDSSIGLEKTAHAICGYLLAMQ